MKDIKNKEIIIGLIALIVLSILAIVLIIKRELPKDEKANRKAVVEELQIEETAEQEAANEKTAIADNKDAQADIALAEEKDNVSEDELAIAKAKANLAIYPKEPSKYHTEPRYKEYTGDEMWQMEEIYAYWDEYKLEAVDDLIHLPRVRTLTNELEGTNSFYYCGEKDSKGNPNGKGLAIYEGNAYFFGEWKSGKRSGEGMYWKIYPDKTGSLNGVPGVIEHIYNGSWLNDYPNGEGQEHVTYDYDIMEGDYIINNVIGNFVDGYYDGELYIMSIEGENNTTDWKAKAEKGVFQYIDKTYSAMGRRKVWERMEWSDSKGDDNYAWIYEDENTEYGISGLTKEIK